MKAPLKGLVFLLAAAFFFSIMSILVKTAGARLPSPMLVLARAVITLVLSLGFVWRARVSPFGHRKGLLVLRALLGFGGLLCFFTALTWLPLAEVTVLHYLNPVLVAVMAFVFLKERVGVGLVIALVLGVSGVLFVARPSSVVGAGEVALNPWGVAAALGGALFAAGAYTTVRKLKETEHPLVIVLYFAFVAVPLSLPFAIPTWVTPVGIEWLLLLGIGVSTQVAQVLLTWGIALVPVGRATAVGYVQIVFAAGFGVLLFDEQPHWATVVGALLVALGFMVLVVTRGHSTPTDAAP